VMTYKYSSLRKQVRLVPLGALFLCWERAGGSDEAGLEVCFLFSGARR
jgi:hypothetical protein